MLRGTEDGSMLWEPTMAASTGRMAIEERMAYDFMGCVVIEELFVKISNFDTFFPVSKAR
jgi:hypothetical protein